MRTAAALLLAVGACGGTVILGGTPSTDVEAGEAGVPEGGSGVDAGAHDDGPSSDAPPEADACAALDAGSLFVQDEAGAAGSPEVLATAQAAPTALRLQNGVVYWANSAGDAVGAGSIMSYALSACPNDVHPLVPALTGPNALVISGAYLYWLTEGSNDQNHADGVLGRVPLAGGVSPTLLTSATRLRPTGLDVAAGRTFWTEQGVPPYDTRGGGVYDCASDGCGASPEVIATGSPTSALYRAYAIVTDGTTLYFSVLGSFGANYDDGAIYQCPVAACPGNVTPVATGQRVTGALALQGSTLFWTTEGWPPGANGGTVMKCSVAACEATKAPLAQGLDGAYALAVDSTYVYFSELGTTNRLNRVPVGGGQVGHLLHAASGVYGVALDDTYVYFTIYGARSDDGILARLPK